MSWYNTEDGLSEYQGRRLEQLAQRKAADDPALNCRQWMAVQLTDAPTPASGGWAFIASYGGRSVAVEIRADALDNDGEE